MIYCHLNFHMLLKYYYELIIFIYMKNIFYKLFCRMNFAGTTESDSDENAILHLVLRVNNDHNRGRV